MIDLITRLEQAEAGSQLLDLALIVAVSGIASTYPVPSYTSSLDAITALIGEKLPGYYFGLQENRWPQEPEITTRRWSAYLNAPLGSESEGTHRDKYIACCIALLRAIKEGADG